MLMVGGVKGATIDDLKASTATSYMNGLVLIGELSCDPFNMLCNDFTDFQTQPVPMATALALRYKAGELFIYNILKSNMINRHTMLDREGLMGLKSTYNKKYLELLDYLAQTIDSSDRGCLKCKASQGYNKTSIRL